MFSMPVNSSYFPAGSRLLFNSLFMALNKVSRIREDLPPPETPVMQVNVPRGIFKFTFFRLWVLAPLRLIKSPFPLRRLAGTEISFCPFKYCAVKLFGFFKTSATVPSAITFPPSSPAPGPISTK